MELAQLKAKVDAKRLAEMEAVLARRTRHVTAVTEDLYQPHNGAAVIRACECFGVQDLHAISNRNPFRVNPETVQGADRYVSLHRYNQQGENNTRRCYEHLKAQGYRILATSLRDGCVPLAEVDLSQPVALVYGTELKGLSDLGHELADGFVRIPMYGFTQSFNISVSAALSLSELTTRLRASSLPWALSRQDRDVLLEAWLRSEIGS